jgi:uncharacterized membrane protein
MDDFDLYRLFKTLHVIAVVLLGGGFVLEAITGVLVARVRTVQEARAYATLLYISENYLSPAAALVLAVFGYATADRFGYDLDVTWLLLGQVLFFGIVVLAIVFLRSAAKRLYALTREAPDGPLTPEIAAQLKSRPAAIVGPITSVMFVFVIYLMVARPGW